MLSFPANPTTHLDKIGKTYSFAYLGKKETKT